MLRCLVASNYIQNWDKKGNIYYTNDKGEVVDFKVNPFTQLANKAKATIANAQDWINETDPNSEAYKQKIALATGIMSMPFGIGATATNTIAKGLVPVVGKKIAQSVAQGISGGVAGGAVEGMVDAGLNNENIAIGGLKGASAGALSGGLGVYGLSKGAQQFAKKGLQGNTIAQNQYFDDYIDGLANKTKATADFRAGKSGVKNGKMQLAYDLVGDEVPLTETQAFKNWFGNSKIVDENGNPMIFYHGSPNKFEIFDKNRQTEGQLGKGFYFTNNRQEAGNYGIDNVYAVYLQMKKPFDIDADINTISKQLDIPVAELENLTPADVIDVLKQKGFDGIVAKNYWGEGSDYYTVFEPTQIKSVNNQGTFDPTNPNIYKSILAPIGAGAFANRLLNEENNNYN